jgi:hypothetical protein
MPRGNGPRRPGAQAAVSRVAPGAATAVTSADRASVGFVEAVHDPQVQKKLEAGAYAGCSQRSDVAVHELNLDTCLARPFARGRQGLGDEVDSGHLPAPRC